MDKIASEKLHIKASSEKVYGFVSDFNNFENLMPDQVVNWQSSGDTCSFRIEGLADISMKITGKNPFNRVFIESDGNNPFDFNLECIIENKGTNACESKIIFYADLNPMYSMLMTKPLASFVNILNEKLKEKAEQDFA